MKIAVATGRTFVKMLAWLTRSLPAGATLFDVTLEIPDTQPLRFSQDLMSIEIQFSGIMVPVASKHGYCPTEAGQDF